MKEAIGEEGESGVFNNGGNLEVLHYVESRGLRGKRER